MNKKTRRNVIRICALIFWIVLALLARSERFKLDKDPYIYAILAISFIGYIVYENFYRLPKIEQIKKSTKEQQLATLLKEKDQYTPKLNFVNIPEELHSYIPIATKWGINNKILREHLFNSADNSELLALKEIESKIDIITSWAENKGDHTSEKNAFLLTLEAYNELGLWTWGINNDKNYE